MSVLSVYVNFKFSLRRILSKAFGIFSGYRSQEIEIAGAHLRGILLVFDGRLLLSSVFHVVNLLLWANS